jgi:hypothetical protein
MSFAWLPCVLLCLSAAQGDALEIANHRRTYGHLGALKPKEAGALPGDTAYFTFEIKNLKLDAFGKASYSIAIEIRDEAGKIFYQQRPYNSVAQNFLGGNSLPCSAHIEIPLDTKPGPVEWKVTVVDRTTKKSVSVAGKGKILPADFGIVQVGLFADAEMRVPMSAVAVVGDSAYVKFAAVGFARDKDKKQPNVEVSMRVLDDKGQPTMAKPIVGKIDSNVDPKEQFLPVQFGLTMNRAGRFTIELTAEDKISGKRSQIRYGMRVLPLE